MALVYYFLSLVIIVILVALKTPWYFVIAIAILCAGWSIADAIRDGCLRISISLDETKWKIKNCIMDSSQNIREVIRELKNK